MESTKEARLTRAINSLQGLSVGDAFGEKFFVHPDVAENLINLRALPSGVWYYTDDTQMALSIVSILRQYQEINQDALARDFAERYDTERGYGPAMHKLLTHIRDNNKNWRQLATSLFNGQGSYGNGAAMRVAPLGAYFADNIDLLVDQAIKSAEITHAHPEASSGAVAVAVAAGIASNSKVTKQQFLNQVISYIPESEVKSKIERASNLSENISIENAAAILGSGAKISAQDTVPFALWCAAQHLDNYTEAIWTTVRGLGDRDTTCAIVGGIVACSAGAESIPTEWLQAREALSLPAYD
ncbi:hydrolase [Dulcicalothrix desertica PCC 7102]|uniref:Hydrolase n=1 Tax=Dulcicalothrix desertica PCC 7102 TaxID=232991 RepID=A0A433VQH1_9CYAN|nr:ADP-ribosylglycohydrolase family protein [Dulcicalothrix desertica]RUT08393.1 hydrolase [Dulcicalothrix desertica PCC 7102]TWH40258.1 ADP-ribosylglycohydrolase [Dulcicalothrix desertica PCC 7102]